jgi:HD-GYP domain-containing protein (c-di-GMP phosphodiesterase class II)
MTRSLLLPDDTEEIRLAELLTALSYALDLTEGQPAGHCVRCCWIGLHIAQALGMSEAETAELYYVLLLKDLGCSSNAARICQLYLTEDFSFKQDYKHIDGSLPQALRFVFAHTGLKAGLAERFRALAHIFKNGGQIARELVETRCQRGAKIARSMRFSEAVAEGIQNLDEHWNGQGKPLGIGGEKIPVYARIALMAQVIDVFFMASGAGAALAEVKHRAGTWFDPAIVEAFETASQCKSFWMMLGSIDLEQAIFSFAPAQCSSIVDAGYLDDIAGAFAQVIDAKSPYTSNHSERVTLFADLIGAEMGLAPEERRWLKRAALLHDIGKLGVSNAILKQHARFSEEILSRMSAFKDLAPIAGAHHERLDGKGYPRGLTEEDLTLATRIITVADIFDALTADRPYREAMQVSKAFAILDDLAGSAVDPACILALKRALADAN